MSLNLNQVKEEYEWNLREEMFDYNAYWYRFLSEGEKAQYRSYLKRVEPLTDMENNPEEYSMAPITA